MRQQPTRSPKTIYHALCVLRKIVKIGFTHVMIAYEANDKIMRKTLYSILIEMLVNYSRQWATAKVISSLCLNVWRL